MALMSCPECEKEISDKAKTCPHCGFPFDGQGDIPEEQPIIDQPDEHDNNSIVGKVTSKISKAARNAIIAIVAIGLVATVALMSTNKSYISSDISYRTPSSWQYSENGTEHYHYPSNGEMLYVGYRYLGDKPIKAEDEKDKLLNAYSGFLKAGPSYKSKKTDYISFKKGIAISSEYSCDFGKGETNVSYFSFLNKQTVYIFTLTGSPGSDDDVQKKMDKIIKTIKLKNS